MAPLFVALSIFIKGLPLVYPGKVLMVVGGGRGGGPCCHFQGAEEGSLLAGLRGPGLKGSLRTPQARLRKEEP